MSEYESADEVPEGQSVEKKVADLRVCADIAYEIGTVLREKMNTLLYNEAFYGIMYQMVNCVLLYGTNVHNFEPNQDETYNMIQWVLNDMYSKNIFTQMQTHMQDRYETEQLLNGLWETPQTKTDDNV